MILTFQPHSTKKDTFKVSSFFSIGILLFSLNCAYVYKLFQGIPYLCSTKVVTCLSLNCVSFILVLIACRFFSKQHFFLIEDKLALFLTFFTLVANFQLFWEPLLFDLPSSYLAGSALLYLHGLIPMFFYSSSVFQALHWVLATVYSVYIHLSTQSFAPELMICYSLSLIFFLYCLQNHNNSSQSSCEETKHTSSLISTLIPLFFDSSDELYFILNKDLETIAVTQAFSKEFDINSHRPTKILDILGQFKHASCTSQLFKILQRDQPYDVTESSNCHRESTAATPTTWTSSLKRLTSDDIEDFSLKRLSGLLFTHSQALKTNGFGWNATAHKPKMHETAVSFRSKTIQVQFSYLEENGQDFVLFRLGSKSHLTVTEKSANFSATDVATIIHELRTPLNGTIFLLQQAMEHSTVADDVKQEMLEPSLESAKRLHFLINDMLDFAQILEGKFRVIFESFNLEKALGHPVKLISALAKTKGVIVDLIIDRNVPTKIISDQNRLMQVIYNLLGNAVKFTTKGSIVLSISPSRTKRKAIEFSVKDTGYGIKAEDLGKLFHAFEKIDNWHDNKVGTGLGLCISNAIVKGLGGTGLSVKSEPEKGSTFSFTVEDRTLEQEIDYNKVSMSPKNSCFSGAYLSGRSLQSSSNISESYRSEEFPGAKLSLREMVLKGQVKKGTFRTRSMLTCLDSSEIMPEPRNKEIRTVHFDFNNQTQFSSPGSGFVKSSTSVRYSLDELESPDKVVSTSPKRDRRTTCPVVPSICLTTSCQCPQVIAVDDEPMNLTMLKIICNKLSFELKCFNGGQEAIDHFKRSANCERCDKCDGPALILMDCNMPVKDGFETASELITLMRTQRMKKIPIYACTAEESFSLKNKILQCGMAGTILKPVMKEQLQNLVNESYKKGC